MSTVTQELLDQINRLDEEQQQTVLEFVRKLPTAKDEKSVILAQWVDESRKLLHELGEKYGENHYFNSQALLDELREEESE
jgi:hypothetical protein